MCYPQGEQSRAWNDVKSLCGNLSRSEFTGHVSNLRAAATPCVWNDIDAPENPPREDASTDAMAFLPSPLRYASWLACRLGVDISPSDGGDASGVMGVRTAVLGGSATSPATYASYPADFPRASLVLVDPPFGLGSGPAWDKAEARWTPANLTTALNILKGRNHLSDTRLVVAVYTREEDLHKFQQELEEWDPLNHKQSLRVYMARDGTHQMLPGAHGGGARVAVLVVQYYVGDVKVEESGLGACFFTASVPRKDFQNTGDTRSTPAC